MTDLEFFKHLFLDKQQEIIKSSAARATDTIDVSGDESDMIQANLIKNVSDQLSRRELEYLRQIDKALVRINQGNFGVCEDCEEEISEKRLKAMPYSSLCISCASEREFSSKIG